MWHWDKTHGVNSYKGVIEEYTFVIDFSLWQKRYDDKKIIDWYMAEISLSRNFDCARNH